MVARPQMITNYLRAIFNNFRLGLGTGINQFYQIVASKYLNIKRRETTHFLQQQGNYVLPKVS